MTMRPFTGDPLSACCGDPGDCSQAHLYCFNRTPKEADMAAMKNWDVTGSVGETPAQRKVFDVEIEARKREIQNTMNAATHGSIPAQMAVVDAAIERLEAEVSKDDIKRPDHYARFAIEPCTFIMMNELPYWAGNVVKYVTRAPHKHKDERIDIRKAIRYCEMRIEELDRVAAGTDGDVIGNPL